MSETNHYPVLLQGDARYSFHAQAAGIAGVPAAQRESATTFDELYATLRARRGGQAIVAVVNSAIGRVDESYRHLLQGDVGVMDRIDLSIVHPLYGVPGSQLANVTRIHTQEPAWLQCLDTLRANFPGAESNLWVPETDTALSAEIVRRLADPTHAAITPHAAGRAAGLVCIADGLQDNPDNTTTFFRVQHGPHPVAPQEGDLTLALLRSEQPGVYYEACERLAAVGRGLMTLHNSDIAMPSLLVEIAPGANDHQVPSVQDILRDVCDVTVLGGYAP